MQEDVKSIEKILGRGINKTAVKKMVHDYRRKHKANNVLHYAHFTVREVVTLFVRNKILPETVLKEIKGSTEKSEEYGLKIYMGTHEDPKLYGLGSNYKHKDTTILCNTKIVKENYYLDLLDDFPSALVSRKDEINEGDGLDVATVCPPDCAEEEPEEPNPKDGYDVGGDGNK
ncbi:MAG: hypothetical protein ACO1N4_05780 [Pedobacter sp.]